MEERLTKLEELFLHLQRTVQELDQAVIEAHKRMDAIEAQQRWTARQLDTLASESEAPRRPEDEKPPHY
jgi:uncharacterized coiled-coil protein SlyX